MKNTLKTLLTTTFLTLPTILGSDLHSVATQDEVATTESVVGLSRRVFKLKQKGNIRGAATVYYESVCRPDANLYDFIFTARMIEELGCGDIAIQVFEQLRENANTKIYASYAAGEILRLQSQVLPSLPQVGLATKQDDAESMETSSEDGDKAATETDGLSDGNGSDAELEEADTADTVARKAAGTALMEGIKDFQIDSDTLPETIAEQMQYISEALDCQPILSHGQRSEISSIDDKALSLLGNLDPVTAISILCYSANIEIFMEYIPVLRERFYKFFELIRTDVALNKDERAKTLAVIEALCSKLSQSGSFEGDNIQKLEVMRLILGDSENRIQSLSQLLLLAFREATSKNTEEYTKKMTDQFWLCFEELLRLMSEDLIGIKDKLPGVEALSKIPLEVVSALADEHRNLLNNATCKLIAQVPELMAKAEISVQDKISVIGALYQFIRTLDLVLSEEQQALLRGAFYGLITQVPRVIADDSISVQDKLNALNTLYQYAPENTLSDEQQGILSDAVDKLIAQVPRVIADDSISVQDNVSALSALYQLTRNFDLILSEEQQGFLTDAVDKLIAQVPRVIADDSISVQDKINALSALNDLKHHFGLTLSDEQQALLREATNVLWTEFLLKKSSVEEGAQMGLFDKFLIMFDSFGDTKNRIHSVSQQLLVAQREAQRAGTAEYKDEMWAGFDWCMGELLRLILLDSISIQDKFYTISALYQPACYKFVRSEQLGFFRDATCKLIAQAPELMANDSISVQDRLIALNTLYQYARENTLSDEHRTLLKGAFDGLIVQVSRFIADDSISVQDKFNVLNTLYQFIHDFDLILSEEQRTILIEGFSQGVNSDGLDLESQIKAHQYLVEMFMLKGDVASSIPMLNRQFVIILNEIRRGTELANHLTWNANKLFELMSNNPKLLTEDNQQELIKGYLDWVGVEDLGNSQDTVKINAFYTTVKALLTQENKITVTELAWKNAVSAVDRKRFHFRNAVQTKRWPQETITALQKSINEIITDIKSKFVPKDTQEVRRALLAILFTFRFDKGPHSADSLGFIDKRFKNLTNGVYIKPEDRTSLNPEETEPELTVVIVEDVVKFLTKNVIDKQGTMTEFGMATSEAREKAQRFLDVRSLGLSPETTVEINGSIGHLEEEIGVLGLLNSSENGMNRDPKRITMPSGCPDILKPFYERLQAVYDSEAGKECYGLFDENEGINEVMKRLESMGFAAFHQQYSDPLTHQKASETMRRVRKNIRLAYVKPEEAENTFDGASVVKKEWTRGMEWILVPDDLPEGARIVRVTAKGESWWEAVYFKLQETEPVERS